MRDWKTVSIDADIEIYFCDPHAPWQRGSNENTNGLLRQYFPKGTDLGVYSEEDLDRVAAELNDRPRKRLAFEKPIEAIEKLLLQ
jgi:IS30 family transposase